MKKDAYYFPHFCNARHDRKIKRVIKELGVEGYGIYFMLLEVLREQTDFKFPLGDLDLLADEFRTSEQKVRTVVSNYGLFDVDEQQNFFSMKLVFYIQPYIEATERARKAANIRWAKVKKLQDPDANTYANALHEDCEGNADAMQGEEKKGEEKKEKEYNAHFEKCWKAYPVKKGKDKVTVKDKKELLKFSFEEIQQAINNLIKEYPDKQFQMHGRRFFKGEFKDYLKSQDSKEEWKSERIS